MYYNNISNDDDIEIIYWGNEEENNTVNSDKIKKHRKKKDDYDWKKEAMGFLKIIAIAVVIAFAINNLVIINMHYLNHFYILDKNEFHLLLEA